MKCAPDGRILVVSDTDVLINFLRVGRLELLCRHADYRVVITEHTRGAFGAPGEVTDNVQLSELEAAISSGEIEATSLTDISEIGLFASLNAFLGRGEAAAIAVATSRGWVVATDDRRAGSEIQRRLGANRRLTTPGILLRCIERGHLTVVEADTIKSQLAECRFIMKFASFGDLRTPVGDN